MVYQENLKKMSYFLTKVCQQPNLSKVIHRLWFCYLNKWRESSFPLLSKFTFSHPGHFEKGLSSKQTSNKPHSKIPQNIIDELEMVKGNNVQQKTKKAVNYDFIFGEKSFSLLKHKRSIDLTDLKEKSAIFLSENELKEAKDFFLKSKRRFKSERKISKKALNTQKVRRRSSVLKDFLGSGKEKEEKKLSALEELEVNESKLGHTKKRVEPRQVLEDFLLAV